MVKAAVAWPNKGEFVMRKMFFGAAAVVLLAGVVPAKAEWYLNVEGAGPSTDSAGHPCRDNRGQACAYFTVTVQGAHHADRGRRDPFVTQAECLGAARIYGMANVPKSACSQNQPHAVDGAPPSTMYGWAYSDLLPPLHPVSDGEGTATFSAYQIPDWLLRESDN